jgi:hypothetical protein
MAGTSKAHDSEHCALTTEAVIVKSARNCASLPVISLIIQSGEKRHSPAKPRQPRRPAHRLENACRLRPSISRRWLPAKAASAGSGDKSSLTKARRQTPWLNARTGKKTCRESQYEPSNGLDVAGSDAARQALHFMKHQNSDGYRPRCCFDGAKPRRLRR